MTRAVEDRGQWRQGHFHSVGHDPAATRHHTEQSIGLVFLILQRRRKIHRSNGTVPGRVIILTLKKKKKKKRDLFYCPRRLFRMLRWPQKQSGSRRLILMGMRLKQQQQSGLNFLTTVSPRKDGAKQTCRCMFEIFQTFALGNSKH